MADLAQVVGGLLRDLAKARFGSDLYARDVARYYEQDGLLRRFPVPRPEVTEVEIDLKFQVGSVDPEPTQHELTEATLATVHEPFASRITIAVMDGLRQALERTLREGLQVAPSVRKKAGRTWVLIDVRKAALKVLLDAWGRAAEPRRPEDLDRLTAQLRTALADQLARDLEPTDAERQEDERQAHAAPQPGKGPRSARDLAGAALEGAGAQVQELVKRLAAELAQASAGRGDCRVNVEVGHDRLSAAPPGALSSIRVKATVKNYVWTQVSAEKGDTHWYALNPE